MNLDAEMPNFPPSFLIVYKFWVSEERDNIAWEVRVLQKWETVLIIK